MMNVDFQFRDKIKVGILGATGTVGQRFVELLANHPWFQISALCASEKSIGKKYGEAVNWILPSDIPSDIAKMEVQRCEPNFPGQMVFSGLDSSVAGDIETLFAKAGYVVVSNSRNHRMDKDVPLLVPEINVSHLDLLQSQTYGKGKIVTDPNCSVIGLVIALKPLYDAFGIEAINVVTLQAISGAGYPGVASLDILDNVIPFIDGEEEKLETEPLKILGKYENNAIQWADFKISAQCNRVPVTDGHTECVSIKFKKKPSQQEIIESWNNFKGDVNGFSLPFSPEKLIYYFENPKHPQPKLHRNHEVGMAVSIGRLRDCPIMDYKFTLLSHNTIRGAAGAAILNAELLVKKGYIFW